MATKLKKAPEPTQPNTTANPERREYTFDIFRRWGYLQTSLDPLGQYLPGEPFPVPVPEDPDSVQAAAEARKFYCGTIAAEFMHIPSPEKRQWIQDQLEREAPPVDQKGMLTDLIKADLFEQVIQSRYLGTKRFSLEGLTVLIPFLNHTFEISANHGVTRSVFGMSHRGRLNVMTNIVGRNATDIFARFEDVDPRSTMGGGDVKYHQGATGEFISPNGKKVALHLVSNPSHLEAVDPVALGRARARQARLLAEGAANAKEQILPLIIHGDAAFAGQGILAESLNMAVLHGYNVGGTIHVIVNNLLGFTAVPEESNSSRFATDIAKRLPIPIFHVNAEDPDAVLRVAAIAAEYRHKFKSDVVVDLIGYRRHGHSEVDDPTVTSPKRYALIKDLPELYKTYAKRIGVDPTEEAAKIQQHFLEEQKLATKAESKTDLAVLPHYWDNYKGGSLSEADAALKTGIDAAQVTSLTKALCAYPETFHIHPKVKKLYEQRLEMAEDKRQFDYGMAELLAFASLVSAGTPVRLTGQDSQRGTFNQRHSALTDTETETKYIPLEHITPNQARFEVYNTLLSEAAVLGYEYGYSRDYPEALVLWEAQFGDFANGAQIIVDQFISAGEAKWHLLSGLVMLLPHGYEGQGPEHSSARIERYLQLCAQDNMVIAQPSTAAQHFHLLRRQALRSWRKPLIVFTPKSMLRHPDASSTVADFGGTFQNVLPDNGVQNPRRILLCSGKIGHNLRVEREKRQKAGHDANVAIVFLEQLYPWPEAEVQAALDQHRNAEVVYVQEEPANMGARSYVMPHLRRMSRDRAIVNVTRSAGASPATGSAKAHDLEERALIDMAFGV
ncbi:2-oxoglutarate dehydrogenase E1 component [Granulicella tundricola]|uniref:oxoglutarate dehydrogenase (succinyl-transferring) n=1 Tax=Granulicella tundricola (strain ATCC BAA-1859 / DSM 23138 / MP5ACTX9) TaxID=1198114 RepID=E8WXW3_GRATM|nr:2-oxoglutarate dehydrogenase E1 component [Granulicella tundricola]ADW69808.1 2-oxoglutarate dehydrogenase, E1 subunit [Granulicella tundricola MP5ACTX9]